ncbi:FMN-binding negative transcriptional regulator [Saccharothrix isguenensis]
MFVPRIYQVDEERWPIAVVDRYPLAVLTTNGVDVPHATHVPVIRPARGERLVGEELIAHMNRVNPHWLALSDDAAAKLVFFGPQGYVTPSVYHVDPAVPTWNFVAVHLTGTLRVSEEASDVLSAVTATARTLEHRFGVGFDVDRAADHHARIASGVGAIRFRVTKVEAMFKLSQEKDPEVRDRVAEWFDRSDTGTHADLAAMMRMFSGTADLPPHRTGG